MTYHSVLPSLAVCTHDPAVDTSIARNLHRYNMWEASGMVVAIKRLVTSGTICTRERPFVLDLGMNIGVYSLIFLALGCHVVAFEPLAPNLFRARESARANGFADRISFYQNAVSNVEAPLYIRLNAANPGASQANPSRDLRVPPGTVGEEDCVMSITLDALFTRADRPRSPTTGKPLVPAEISFLKVDVEGFDVAVYDGMQDTLQAAHPIPFATIEYNQAMAFSVGQCWGEEALKMLDALGYAFWDHHDVPLVTAELLGAAEATSERKPKAQRRGAPPYYEMWLQHRSVDPAVGLQRQVQLA
jgi:FkbM family methyltransferase